MKEKPTTTRVCSIGGQAVMEGVMMKSPQGIAMAVRTGDGTIVTDYMPSKSKIKKNSILAWPVIRGVVTFIESLTVGMKTITRSAELYGEDFEEEPGKFEKWLSRVSGKSIDKIVIGFAVVLAVALSVGLFFMLPTFISGLLLRNSEATPVVKALIEGVVRLCIFLGYLFAIRLMKDAKRLFMYHGAEHKVIACYEHEAPLTPESAKNFSRFHPRCGTNYMFLVMAVSILFFAVVGFNENFWMRLGTRLLFLPVVAGLSYEVLRFGGKSNNLFARIARAPGLALQRLTTIEPDEGMLEVAITAFNLAMEEPEVAAQKATGPLEKKKTDRDEAEQEAPAAEKPETEETGETAPAHTLETLVDSEATSAS
ncbi:DUF1385 domain-containing protein [Christensenellaceae bacterium OttesenSCG-928-L17]|nr:DUF1385 domain-containing protein [Christensenellaceae bacterium OttesenSCG-928-L17]